MPDKNGRRTARRLLTSITTQFCFAGLSIFLNVYALSVMATAEALVFVTAFALAQSYAPLHNCVINLTLASLAPRLSTPRRAGYGTLTWRWCLFLSLLHAVLLGGGWLLLGPAEGRVGIALALFFFCGAAGPANYLRQWLFQQLAFGAVLRIDILALIVAMVGMAAILTLSNGAVLNPAALLAIGASARFAGFVFFRRALPVPHRMAPRLARGFAAIHWRESRQLVFFSLANYLRLNFVYVILASVAAPGSVLLLRSADLLLLPLRQISGGAISLLVPLVSKGGASREARVLLFAAAGTLGAVIALVFLLLRQTSLPDLLPERFEIAIAEGGLLLAAHFATHFLVAAALGLLRGTFAFGRLVWVSVLANGIGITGLVAAIYITGDWRAGLAGFVVTDLLFLALALFTGRKAAKR